MICGIPSPVLCYYLGQSLKVISEALGHSSVAFTMDVYSHIISGMQEDAMALLDEVLPAGVISSRLVAGYTKLRGIL